MQKYAHPPIKEAVIDIQLIFDSPLDIEKIKSYILDFEHANYSLKNSIIEGTIGFDLTDSNINNSNNSVSIIGCRTETPDGSYIAQLKIKGMTLSNIAPYKGWESFKREAILLWDYYKKILPPFKFSRLAVRFINEISLPLVDDLHKSLDFDDYLINSPVVPKELESGISGFFTRSIIPILEHNAEIIIVQSLKEVTVSHAIVLLDTDIYCPLCSNFSEQEVWGFFETLRILKNKAFEGSLTEKAKDLFR